MTRLRVLVVDDQPDAAYIVCVLLEVLGHTCVTAMTGQEALAVANDFEPDVAIVDIGLPDLSGYEIARALRAQPRFSKVFLAALTGWGTALDQACALDAGFDCHVTKPADRMKLQEILEQAATRVGARDPILPTQA